MASVMMEDASPQRLSTVSRHAPSPQTTSGVQGSLAVIIVGDDPASRVYHQLRECPHPLPPAVAADPGHLDGEIVAEVDRGTPPKKANADTWPSRNASVVSAG